MTTETAPARIPSGEIRGNLTTGTRSRSAMDRVVDLAHRDPGHIGRLDTCTEELCRALSAVGMY